MCCGRTAARRRNASLHSPSQHPPAWSESTLVQRSRITATLARVALHDDAATSTDTPLRDEMSCCTHILCELTGLNLASRFRCGLLRKTRSVTGRGPRWGTIADGGGAS